MVRRCFRQNTMPESSPHHSHVLRRLEGCVDELTRAQPREGEEWLQSVARHIRDLRSISAELQRQLGEREGADEDHRRIVALVDHSNDFIGLATLEGDALFVNRAGQAMMGLRDDAHVRATKVYDYVATNEHGRFSDALATVVAEGRWGGEMDFRHFESGALIPMLAQIFYIREAGTERPLALATISRNITERKRAEAEAAKWKDELAHDLHAMVRLHELSTRLLDNEELAPLLEDVLDATIHLQAADFGLVQTIDPQSRALAVIAQRGFGQDALDYFQVDGAAALACGRALLRRERVIIEDVLLDPEAAADRAIAASAGFRAAQCTPMVARSGRLLGIISTCFRHPHRLSERDSRFTDLYARQAAELIDRKQAETALVRAKEEAERRARDAEEAQSILHTIMENAPEGITLTAGPPDFPIIANSKQAEKMIGRRAESLVAISAGAHAKAYGLLLPDGTRPRPEQLPLFRASRHGEVIENEELIIERLDGSRIHTLSNVAPIRDFNGRIIGAINCWRDITPRKRAQEKLRRSEAYLAEGERLSHTASWAWNVTTGDLFWSPELFRIYGLDPETTKPGYPSVMAYIHPEDRARVQRVFEDAVRERRDYELAYRVVWRDGTIRHVNNIAHPAFDAAGAVVEYVGTTIDTTEREQSEAALRDSSARLEQFLGAITDNFFGLSADFRFTYLNRHAEEQMRKLGKDPAQLIGKVLWEEFPEVPNAQNVRRVITERVPITEELYYAPLGEWVENHMYPSHDGGLVTFQRYITGRKRAEEALRLSEERFRRYFELGLIGMAITLPSKGCLEVNDEFCRILGYEREELLKKSWPELTHPADLAGDLAHFERVLAGEMDGYTLDKRFIRKDGQVVDTTMAAKCLRRADGTIAYFVALVQDITERRRAEEAVQKAHAELARVTRITAMGELAASIGHELSQPLGAILNNSNTCLRLSAHGRRSQHEWHEALVDIIRDAERASEIIRRIRALGQQSTEGWAPLHLASVLGNVLALIRPELMKRHLVVEASVPRRLPHVIGDRVQLQQVFLNLIMNAIEAVSAAPESKPRTIVVAGSGYRLGERAAVLITVSDSGPGIKADVAARLFEPFFTTKSQGTGMGLRISRSIVEAHGGEIWLLPDQDEGATFCFALPVGDKAVP